MQNLWPTLIFLFSSLYVIILDYFAFSSRGLQKSLVLPLLILVFIIYRSSVTSWKTFIANQGKWFLLLWGTILVQTLVIATGGLQSPFLILIHLFMIGISFVFSFSASVIFLLLSFVVIFVDISFNSNVLTFLTTDPGKIILQLVSLFSVIPLAYIISQQYHIKDLLMSGLRAKVTTDEAILESLDELIIVTDPQLTILSVNDATQRTLQKSRSELIGKPLFTVLFLKTKHGVLANKDLFFPNGDTSSEPKKISDEFIIINSPPVQNTVTIQTQAIKNIEANINHISFVLRFIQSLPAKENSLLATIEQARAKYEAMSENLKNKLSLNEMPEIQNQMILLEKIESDIYNAHAITSAPHKIVYSRIDIAKLCEELVALEQNFAKSLQVPISFTINNFGNKDIAPLTVKNYPVEPSQLTGPFFTIPCDVNHTELLLTKLLDLCLLIASSTKNPYVALTIDREGTDAVIVKVQGSCPPMNPSDAHELYYPNYGALYSLMNLHAGSGLEGFLVKTLSNALGVPLDTKVNEGQESSIEFTIAMKKTVEAMSKQAQ